MSAESRIHNAELRSKLMSAEEAVKFINNGARLGVSGFTGSGFPKAIPAAVAKKAEEATARGETFRVGMWTGASTAPTLDGILAKANAIETRFPYQSDPECRKRINAGDMNYFDMHLSHVSQFARYGFLGKLDFAVIEVAAIIDDKDKDGRIALVPTTSMGNNQSWLDVAEKVILEVNTWQREDLEGMHDVFAPASPPNRTYIPIMKPCDRIGDKYMRCCPKKIVAVVACSEPDRNSPFATPEEDHKRIAGHILDFFAAEMKAGRLPEKLFPLQSGVGNIANAVLEGLNDGPYVGMTSFTEVLQDGMLTMLKSGKLSFVSATAFSLSPDGLQNLNDNFAFYKDKIVLRPQEISNNPEVIRRMGVISMNGMIEADIYGNVNSTHIMGTAIMNGIGGSGDFARNAYYTIFMTPSVAKGGALSCIVPMVTHVDHTEHDVSMIVTEQGLADLRGLAPKQRALEVINKCAHPDFRPALMEYVQRAAREAKGIHTPHIMNEAFSWHINFMKNGRM